MVRDAGEPVDYTFISVRNLGTIYEGLLENRLVLASPPGPLSPQEMGPGGEVALVNDKGERKLSGSYYTPDFIVEYIVSQTLDPILDERSLRFSAALGRIADLRKKLHQALDKTTNQRLQAQLASAERDALEAFLGIKVCDPAMGSGHFLVNAVDHLTDGIIRRMQVYHDTHPSVPWDWNPVQRLIERVRREIEAEMARQGIAVDAARLDDTALLTRLVMKRCIYGVDLNPLAVELAKLSLWLHTFTVGAPLSFLDHHLRWGNSVLGADVRTVERAMRVTDAGQLTLFQGPFAGLLDLTAVMIEVAGRADSTLADVQQSAEAYAAFQRQLLPYKQALDLWVSQWFDDERPSKSRRPAGSAAFEFMTMHSGDVLPALAGEIAVDERYQGAIARARGQWEQQRFFHWDLEFPEVFIDLAGRDWAADGGFDAMLGNPPYVRQEQVSAAKRYLAAAHAPVYDAAADLYVYFYHRGCEMLRRGGRLAFIVNNKWLRAGYGEPLRRYLAEQTVVERIVDFGHAPIFPDADTFPCIAVLRKPAAEPAAPAETEVCAFPREELGHSDLTTYVEAHSHRVPAGRFSAAPWSLEPPDVNALMTKIRRAGVPLLDFIGGKPYRGILTGLNEVFSIDTPTRDRLVTADPSAADVIVPYLRGQDIKRWHPEWASLWMILLKSSENFDWPWSKSGESAEAIFAHAFPSLHAYLKPHEGALRKRQDQGRFWWELRSCDYYSVFRHPKIIHTDIAWRAQFAYSDKPVFLVNTAYVWPTNDLYLLAVVNSPLMWAYMWRNAMHGKDEVLRLIYSFTESLPIAQPDDSMRSEIEPAVQRLITLTQQNQVVVDEVLVWLTAEFGVTTPGQALGAFGNLDEGAFIQQVRARRPKGEARLSPAGVGELARVYRQYALPLRAGVAESARLEGRLAELVNAAYGLTPDEVALLWRTAPPRMPVSQPMD
ncbi:MAG: Eco57I restriction-modification methylase domain-containing protein [Anaerolineae bacterium]|nr:Eco57I restriction-modification methylase domain-containing protein [Anaerolineae bacterium]